MRKLFFMLAFMLVTMFTFASNSNYMLVEAEDAGICTVTITQLNSDGTTNTWIYRFETSTEQDCQNAGQVIFQAFLDGNRP